MVERIQAIQVRQTLLNLMTRITDAKDELNIMDSACGDGDFGTSMWISFSNARKQIDESTETNVGTMLLTAGQAILSSAGGAAGPIFGLFFIEAGKAAKGMCELSIADLAKMFDASLIAIKRQGGAKVGDKTVVDALEPAVNALKESANKSGDVSVGLKNAANAAEKGCESTKEIIARHGKAKYLEEQTLGYVDPGAHVMAIIFETLAESCRTVGA